MKLTKKKSNYDKAKTLGRTSEAFFEISEQPKNTCPMIDSVIDSVERLSFDKSEIDDYLSTAQRRLKSAIRSLQWSDASDTREVIEALSELDSISDLLKEAASTEVSLDTVEVKWIIDELEEVRTNCENIRMWGQEWKDLFISVFNYPMILFKLLFFLWFDRNLTTAQKKSIQVGSG
jgi:hypothetical protein